MNFLVEITRTTRPKSAFKYFWTSDFDSYMAGVQPNLVNVDGTWAVPNRYFSVQTKHQGGNLIEI